MQMSDRWTGMFHHVFQQDVDVCGYRIELSVRFLGGSAGIECKVEDCFRAIIWLLQDISMAFKALSMPTSSLLCRRLPVYDLYKLVEETYARAEEDFYKICRGQNSKAPKEAAVKYLGMMLNFLGINYGPK